MTTAGGGHRKRKTIERGVGGFLLGAPLNIYPDWRGLPMQCARRYTRPPPLLLVLVFFVPISFHIQKQEPAVFDEVRLMKCVWLSPRNAPLNIIRLRSAPRIQLRSAPIIQLMFFRPDRHSCQRRQQPRVSWSVTCSALARAAIEEATRVHRVALRAEQVDDSAQIFWHCRRGRRHRCAR